MYNPYINNGSEQFFYSNEWNREKDNLKNTKQMFPLAEIPDSILTTSETTTIKEFFYLIQRLMTPTHSTDPFWNLVDYFNNTIEPLPIVEKIFNYYNETLPTSADSFVTFIETFIQTHYGELEIRPEYACWVSKNHYIGENNYYINQGRIVNMVYTTLKNNAYKYNTLLESTKFDYNPIWNVESHEESVENRGAKKETNVYGAKTNTTQYGSKTDTTQYGIETDNYKYDNVTTVSEEKNTITVGTTIGSRNDTNGISNGNKVETTTHFNTQMNNTQDWYNHDRDETVTQPYTQFSTTGSQTNSQTTSPQKTQTDVDSRDDTIIYGSHTDTTTNSTHTDTITNGGYTDTKNNDRYSDTITVDRHGNIGTKTTQSMIKEEREVALFEFLSVLCKDIIKIFTIAVYY